MLVLLFIIKKGLLFMEDIQNLKIKVGEILKQEVSDYLPVIDEESSFIESSTLEKQLSIFDDPIDSLKIYKTFTSLESLKSQNTESENFDSEDAYEMFSSRRVDNAGTRKNLECYRTAIVINRQETAQFFKLNQENNNLLWEAIEHNDIKEVKKLLDLNKPPQFIPQVNAPGLNNWTALHMAAARGFLEICETIITIGGISILNARTSMNRTPLHLASIQNHIKVVSLLINQGAKVDLIDNDYNTCLHYASNQGYNDIIELLLKKNSKVNIKNNLGRTPIDIALNFKTYSIFVDYCKIIGEELSSTGYNRTVFYNTLRHNSREDQINKYLLKSKIHPNKIDIKLFNDRPKLERFKIKKKKILFTLPDSKVGPYDFNYILQLGKGSFGHVFLIEKKDTLEKFALKILDKEKIYRRKLEKYAFTERNILMNISHPFIAKLYYAYQTHEKLALVMDYCPNGDLSMTLDREKILPENIARFYIVEILLGLQELHSHNIIFRDLKPDNILIDGAGHIKITDFGLSKEGMYNGKMAKSFCGSAAYFAPEMVKRKGHTKSID